MNARIKIGLAIAGGALIGATVLGTAFAATGIGSRPFYGGMMGGLARNSSTATNTIYAQMQEFMDEYRTPSGGFDMTRMHADVTSGKVTPPCVDARTGAASGSRGRGYGYGMMGGYRN